MTPNATINVSVSNHYREPTYASEITSQGVLGERVEIIEQRPLFTKILQADGYTSWISSDQVYPGPIQDGKSVTVTDHFMRIRREPSRTSEGIRDAVVGCTLRVIQEIDDWYQIILPDNLTGWAEKRQFGHFPSFSPENILSLAREFLGYHYFWGGRSPKGFDCSGFVQTVFGLLGITLPRDSWQQQLVHIVSDDFHQARPGDLLFFAKTPERVTHVAIAVGSLRFIHASGWVRYNSFRENDADYSPEHLKTFVSVNRFQSKDN